MLCLHFTSAIIIVALTFFVTFGLTNNRVENATVGLFAENPLGRSAYTPPLPRNCAEALSAIGSKAESGIYQIYLAEWFEHPFYVYCLKDPNGGDAWTLIQRRQDGLVNFYRTWHDYQTGFGNLDGNFFIGLNKLHALTQVELQELRIEMMDFAGTQIYAKYESFVVGNEEEKYALNILGKYSGTAGEALRGYHDGQKFSTFDQDNDEAKENCAEIWHGAWWYKDCWWSNLNGSYNNTLLWNGRYPNGMRYTHMAIRPKKR